MLIENYFDTYKEEIELIDTQNRVELDLYSIIAYIIRMAKSSKHISLRDVSGRRETDFSKAFMGESGFPDFVIRSREKNNTAKVLGAIEIKYISENLDSQDHLDQLSGHISSYKKVIYTNGLEWRFYNNSLSSEKRPIILGEYNRGNFKWNGKDEWDKLLNSLNELCWF